ncbi:Ankyrin repeat domain-containing protein 50-like protein 3 [Seiridium cupressi]
MKSKFRRRRDGDAAQTAGSPGGNRVGFWRNLFGRKRGAESQPPSTDTPSVTCSASSTYPTPTGPSDDASSTFSTSTNQSLWDHAYKALEKQSPDLIKEYQDLLAKEAQSMALPVQTEPSDSAISETRIRFDRTHLLAISEKGLTRMEERKTMFGIGDRKFVPKEQINHAAELVLRVKDFIGEAVKASPEASIAWVGVCLVLPLLTNPTTAEEANRDGFVYVTTRMHYYTALETLVKRLSQSSDTTDALTEAYSSIVSLYESILDFQFRSVLRFHKNGLKRYAGDVLASEDWNKKREGIEKLEATVNGNLRQINELKAGHDLESLNKTSTVSFETLQGLLSLSKQQLRVTEEHRDIAHKQLSLQQDELKRHQSDEEEQCHQLFRLTSSNKDVTYEWYKNRIEARVEGTCHWFLTHDNFQNWLARESGILLVSADPGCGKSVLAKHLIDHVLQSATVCYFFFKDQDQNTVRQALCALLHQLFSQKPFLIKHAMPEFSVNGRGLVNATASLWNIFDSAVRDPQAGAIIIVLDALDECAETEFEGLIQHIRPQFLQDRPGSHQLKFLLTSRPYNQIVSQFRGLFDAIPRVHFPGEGHSDAISQEVNLFIENRAKLLGLSPDLTTHLTRKLLEIPHRTYLWVHLVFDNLKTGDFKKTLKGGSSTIAKLPKNVNEAYDQILQKSKNLDEAKKALAIILAAQRPLTLSEMNIAMNIQNNHQAFSDLDLEDDRDFKSTLRSLCGLFVSIHHGKVYFLHQTAREFLLADTSSSTGLQSMLQWHHSIRIYDAHNVLAEKCVLYLALFNSKNSGYNISNDAFLNYSAKYWALHFHEAEVTDNASIIRPALEICNPDSVSYSAWFEIFWKMEGWTAATNFSSLCISSYLGHKTTMKVLLATMQAEIDLKDSKYGQTPLFWAARNGHKAVVKLFLATGKVDINSKDENGQTPLFWAARNGEEAVVKLLLVTEKVDIDSKDKYGRTPLSLAARNGKEAVVKLLQISK